MESEEERGAREEPNVSQIKAELKSEMSTMFESFRGELFGQLDNYFQERTESNEEDSVVDRGPSDEGVAAAVDNYLNDGGSDDKSTGFDALIDEFCITDKPGPAIHEKLAAMVKELLVGKLPKTKLEELLGKYPRPENCPLLVSPKVNKAVWNQLRQNTRTSDKAMQKAQQCFIASTCAMIHACEKAKDDIKTSLTHALVLALAGNHELNLRRREQLRPELNSQFASLCNATTPISSELFGDDLSKEIDEVAKANKLSKKILGGKKPNRKGYHPYLTSSGGKSSYREKSFTATRSRPFLGDKPPYNRKGGSKPPLQRNKDN